MGNRRIVWFIAGFVAAVLASAGVSQAVAQTAGRVGEDAGLSNAADGTGPGVNAGAARAAGASTATRPGIFSDPNTASTLDGTDGGITDTTAAQDGDRALDPDNPQDGETPVPRIGERPVIADGDPNFPAEPTPVQDGIIDVGEPQAVQDGIDPTAVDTRRPEDLAAFENPPAGYDPLLFQIEDVNPVRNNRTTTRLFRQEPYDPIGIRIGSFVLFPEVELATAYSSNVFLSPNARSDVSGEFRPTMRLVSNWNTHALEFRASGDLSEYSRFDSENDRAYALEARGRLDVTRRTNVQGVLSRNSAQEARSSINASAVGTRTTQTTDLAEVALNHRFNRLSLQLRGSVADNSFGDTENLGVVTSNSDRDFRQYEETARATWEFKPTLSVFTEVAVNQRDYSQVTASDGISRTSNGERYRTGVAFGNTGQRLRGEVSLGYGVQRPDDDRLASIDGLIIDANATYRFNDLTSLLFTARSDVSEATAANVGGAMSRQAGIAVRHAFRQYLIGTAGLTYTTQDSQDGVIDDREWRTRLGLEYFANRDVVLFGEYTHTNFDAVGDTTDYTNNEVRMGVRVRR